MAGYFKKRADNMEETIRMSVMLGILKKPVGKDNI
jgi:hypothetical protein